MQTKRDESRKKAIRFGELLDRINIARGEQTLASWVKEACEARLEAEKFKGPVDVANGAEPDE